MTTDADDEIRFIMNAHRWLASDTASRLWSRGWAVANPDADESEPLEWFWPPTAPVGYGAPSVEASADAAPPRWPELAWPERQSPWLRPTRLTRRGTGWKLDYGEALAQRADDTVEFPDESAVPTDLERIECWPMSVEETRRLRDSQVMHVITAMAHDDHTMGFTWTEPYVSRSSAIRAHQRHEAAVQRGESAAPPVHPRARGDLRAQHILLDGEAWASWVRTVRADGDAWDIQGPKQV
jgi:hypothetical protein